MTTKLLQKHLLKGTREFELVGDTIEYRITTTRNVEESRINPLSERRTELLYHFYFTPDARSSRSEQLDTVARNMEVIREDFAICEQIQRNFDSNAYEPGPLSPRHEAGVAYFQNRLLESLSERS